MCNSRLLRMAGCAVLLCGFLLGQAALAQGSELDRLLNLLVQKRVITAEEAAVLHKDMQADKEAKETALLPPKHTELPPAQKEAEAKKDRPVSASTAMKFSGYVQTRWTSAFGTTNTIELRRARLAVGGRLNERVSYRFQIDAVRSPVLMDARVDIAFARQARLTVGQFKIPFSQENLISSRDLISIERSPSVLALVPGRLNGQNGRDIGVQLEGTLLETDARPLFDYSVGVFNGAGINTRDDNRRKDVATRFVLRPLRSFWVGGDYYNGATGANQLLRERAAVEFGYAHEALSWTGEYIFGRDAEIHRRGWYTQVAYRFRPAWEGVFKFDELDPNRGVAQDLTRTTLGGLNWCLPARLKFQLNYGLLKRQGGDFSHIGLTQLQFQF